MAGTEKTCGASVNGGALVLQDLLPVPDGITAVDRSDRRCVFAPSGNDPQAVRVLAVLVQEQLKRDPFSGHLFAFRGRRTSILTQLAMLIEGIDWRSPERVWRPARVC